MRNLTADARLQIPFSAGRMSSMVQPNLDDLRRRKEIADAERAALEAELLRDDARQKLADRSAVAPTQKAAADRMETAKAAKVQADADKAQSDAEFAALKARFGSVPASGFTGAVKVEEGASSFETSLLSANAA